MEEQRLFSVIISCQQQFAEQLVRHRLGKSYVRIHHPATDEQARDLGLDVATEAARKPFIGLQINALPTCWERRFRHSSNTNRNLKSSGRVNGGSCATLQRNR